MRTRGICSFEGCGKPHSARGYCRQHYGKLIWSGELPGRVILMNVGIARHPLRSVYKNMKSRCTNPRNKFYKNYGGRGIEICDRWLGKNGFVNFVADMGERPEGYTLERKNNDQGYSPDNCVWASRHQQAANTRRNSGDVGIDRLQYHTKVWWRARLTVKGVTVLEKSYRSKEDAIAARKQAEKKYL